MEQNLMQAPNPTPVATSPIKPAIPERTAQMKRVYNRGGLGLIAEFGIFQQIGSIVLIIAAVIGSLVVFLPKIHSFDIKDGGIGEIMHALLDSGVIGWVMVAYAFGMCLGMTVGLLVMRKILTERVPLEKKNLSLGQFLLIALAAFGLWGVGILIGNFPSFFGVEDQGTLQQLLDGLTYEALPMYLYIIIGAPVFEELVCRKFLLDRLHPYGEGYAVAVTALLFGIIHGNSGQFFLAFLLGGLFAVVYLRTGRIIYTMLLHCMINFTASLPELLNMGGIDIETGFVIAVIVLAVAGWIVILAGRKHLPEWPKGSTVPEATRACWNSPGMIIARVAGLVTLVSTDMLTMVMGIIAYGSALPLLKLIPCALAILVVLLLPRHTRRYQEKEPEEEIPAEAQTA